MRKLRFQYAHEVLLHLASQKITYLILSDKHNLKSTALY